MKRIKVHNPTCPHCNGKGTCNCPSCKEYRNKFELKGNICSKCFGVNQDGRAIGYVYAR